MADDNPDNVLSATFPAPPPFWKHFTSENRTRLQDLRDAAKKASDDDADQPTDSSSTPKPADTPLPDLPTELRYLQPPTPPTTGKYRSFGDPYDISTPLTTLSAIGIEQLYPPGDAAPTSPTLPTHLKHTTRSLLLNYLELTGVLAADPAAWQQKYEDLQTLLFNAHHLINEYRPHQARASLVLLMEEQVRRRREEVEGVRRVGERVKEVLGGLGGEGGLVEEGEGEVRGEEVGGRRRGVQGAVWSALDEELVEG